MLHSKRCYVVITFEGINQFFKYKFTLRELINPEPNDPMDGTEALYALQEQLDEILDLKIGETIGVSTDRSDEFYKGMLQRIS